MTTKPSSNTSPPIVLYVILGWLLAVLITTTVMPIYRGRDGRPAKLPRSGRETRARLADHYTLAWLLDPQERPRRLPLALLQLGVITLPGTLVLGRRAIFRRWPIRIGEGRRITVGHVAVGPWKHRTVTIGAAIWRLHSLVFGAAGMGKSMLLSIIARGRVRAGASLIVIDPHGPLVEAIIEEAADELADRGAILLWPGGPQRRVYPWNPLYAGAGGSPYHAALDVLQGFAFIWQLDERNTNIFRTVQHVALLLAKTGWTMLEARRVLTDEHFRQYVVAKAADPDLTQWAAEYDQLSDAERRVIVGPTLTRLDNLFLLPELQFMLGAGVSDQTYVDAWQQAHPGRQSITPADLAGDINRGQHLLCVFPYATLRKNQYLAAALLQNTVLSTLMARHAEDPGLPQTAIIADELAHYAVKDAIEDLYAQVRKNKADILGSVQGPGQCPAGLAAEVKRNSGVKISFKTGLLEEAQEAAAAMVSVNPRHPEDAAIDQQRKHYTALGLGMQRRQFLLNAQDYRHTLLCRTPDYHKRFDLQAGIAIACTSTQHYPTGKELEDELAWRRAWLDRQGYIRGTMDGVVIPCSAPVTMSPHWIDDEQ